MNFLAHISGESKVLLVDVSDSVYFIFSARGWERESPRRHGGEGSIFIENHRRGVSERERGRGAGRVSAANWGFGGGGLNIFFGAEMSTKVLVFFRV